MKKVITFVIQVEVEHDNPVRLKKLIRAARTLLKTTINKSEGMRAVKIKNEDV